jgi:hypothetical protein
MSAPRTPTAASLETQEDASSSTSYVTEEASRSGGLTSSLSAWVRGLATGQAHSLATGRVEARRCTDRDARKPRNAKTKESNHAFSTYGWQWWVIFTNSTKLGVSRAPLRYSTKSMGLESDPLFFGANQ